MEVSIELLDPIEHVVVLEHQEKCWMMKKQLGPGGVVGGALQSPPLPHPPVAHLRNQYRDRNPLVRRQSRNPNQG
jgi:hypothetical protein